MDDPGVADEASVPTFSWQRDDSSGTPTGGYQFNFEFDKTITSNFGVGLNWGYNLNAIHGEQDGRRVSEPVYDWQISSLCQRPA